MNSHLLAEVETTCDRVAILNKGELKYFGGIKEIGEYLGMSGGNDLKVIVSVKGDPQAVNASFDSSSFNIRKRLPHSEFEVEVSVADQDALDGLVDKIRGNGVSLVKLQKQIVGLEDAFLKIVEDPTSQQNIDKYLK